MPPAPSPIDLNLFLAQLLHLWPILAVMLAVWIRIEVRLTKVETKLSFLCGDPPKRKKRSFFGL